MDIFLTPQHELVANAGADSAAAARIRAAFAESSAAGLFALANTKQRGERSVSAGFWHDFARDGLVALAAAPSGDGRAGIAPVPPPEPRELEQRVASAPPLPGAEYLSADALSHLWTRFDSFARDRAVADGLTMDAWLAANAPRYHGVGRVCLHLAENPLDESLPFGFMATYAPRLGPDGRVVYKTLGTALTEFAGASQHDALLRLLRPLHAASERCAWLKVLLDSSDIYQPLAWTREAAYRFLVDIPSLEASGLAVRVPNWWRKRARPRVSVTIGASKGGAFGADAMLDFDVGYALGDETLDASDIEALLREGQSLVRIKGQWVEIDRERLNQALDHWKQVEREVAAGGVSFAEGMRLLAGAPASLGPDEAGTEVHDWSQVNAGPWLAEQLARLRAPTSAPVGDSDLVGTLRPYQEAGRDWLWLLSGLGIGACLADDMGLGKTVQIIALLLAHKRAGERRPPSLLVLPASLLANWKAELARFGPSLRTTFVHPSEADRKTLEAFAKTPAKARSKRDLVVTTYGMLSRQPWLLEQRWHLVIADEAQAIKNAGTRQARAIKKIESHARIAMTGTPVENRVGDLWSLFDFINPGLLGSAKRFGEFAKSLADREPDGYAPLRRLVQPYILRRLKTDRSIISDLPDKTELNAWCGLSRGQVALYADAVKALKEKLDSQDEGIERRGAVLAALMRFKQICNHPAQATGDGDYDESRSGKFARLRELCEEIASRQERLLVFTQFREMTAPLAQHLGTLFGRDGAVLHGGTAVKRRQALVDRFAASDGPPFMVLSLKAGGTGLNLTAASHVIHFDRWWNPAVEAQATDRAFRIGQRRNVMVHKFVCRGTVEERIDAMLADKVGLSDALVGGGAEKSLTEMSNDELLATVALDVNSARQ